MAAPGPPSTAEFVSLGTFPAIWAVVESGVTPDIVDEVGGGGDWSI